MSFRPIEHKWPNGRLYWTVEDTKAREAVVSERGGISQYLDRDIAQKIADKMNGKKSRLRKKDTASGAKHVPDWDDEQFSLVEADQ
jgi:hypothetical protein